MPAPAPAPEKMTWRKKSVSEAAEPGDCKKTSVMMRNIPNQYKYKFKEYIYLFSELIIWVFSLVFIAFSIMGS